MNTIARADFAELDRLLRESAADALLDDDEKLELRQLGNGLARDRVRYLRNRAFDLVRERWSESSGVLSSALSSASSTATPATQLDLLRWLEQVVRTLDAVADPPPVEAHAYFSPGEDCLRKLRELCLGAKRAIDVCVYTVSDDRLCEALVDAHRRGMSVRIIGDDHKIHDAGSDMLRLRDHGIPLRLDASAFHMHHKFALFDGRTLANGSFNWTRSASHSNDENLIVSSDAYLVRCFTGQFDTLWQRYAAR